MEKRKMKLRNKRTGEIGIINYFDNQSIVIYPIDENWNAKGDKKYVYHSIAEPNEEWEDYEEPKEHWCVTMYGGITRIKDDEEPIDDLIEIGNYFNSKEDAYDAWDKLKAWKRLKDKGFRFEYYDYSDRDLHNHIQIKAITNREVEDSMLYKEDLDLLFGGEE